MNTVWEGIIRLNEVAVVGAGERLDIRAGVRLVARPGTGVVVRGELSAEGTLEEPIIFFPEGEWGGLTFAEESRGSLRYARVEGVRGAVVTAMEHAWLSIMNSSLHRGGVGLRLGGHASATLEDCAIEQPGSIGVRAEDEAQASLTRVEFRRAPTGVTLLGAARAALRGCRIEGSPQCGLNALANSEAWVEDCELARNHTALSAGDDARIDARGNHIHDNLVGVHLGARSRGNLLANRLERNRSLDMDVLDAARVRSRLEPRRLETIPFQPAAIVVRSGRNA